MAPGGRAVRDGVVDIGGNPHVADARERVVESGEHGAAVQSDYHVVLFGVCRVGVERGCSAR